MTLVMAHEVPASTAMAVPHSPAGVGMARRRMREELRTAGVADQTVDDAVLVLSELLSNACRHARPVPAHGLEQGRAVAGGGPGCVRAHWSVDGDDQLTVSVTDGGGPTRPRPSTPSVTAHGGRGLSIIRTLSEDWGVRDRGGEVTVWAVLPRHGSFVSRVGLAPGHPVPPGRRESRRAPQPRTTAFTELGPLDGLEELENLDNLEDLEGLGDLDNIA